MAGTAERDETGLAGDPAVDRDELTGFEVGLDGDSAIELAAAHWATRREAGLGPPDRADLAHWLAADPRHPAALDRVEASLARVRQMPAVEVARLRRGLGPHGPAPARRALLPWRPALALTLATCLVLAVAGFGWRHWLQQPTHEARYETARGERLPVQLSDGSRLLLDAASSIEVTFYRDRRVVRQLRGQAMYSVAPRPGQPFQVLAGRVQVEVVGTRFSVRRSSTVPDAVEVAVEAGRVRVGQVDGDAAAAAKLAAAVELTAGQAVDADGSGQVLSPHRIAAGAVAPWRRGRIEFDDTPLVEALAELERYGNTGLVVHDPEVAAMRLGGSFDLTRLAVFAQALPVLLPVKLEDRGGQVEIVRRR